MTSNEMTPTHEVNHEGWVYLPQYLSEYNQPEGPVSKRFIETLLTRGFTEEKILKVYGMARVDSPLVLKLEEEKRQKEEEKEAEEKALRLEKLRRLEECRSRKYIEGWVWVQEAPSYYIPEGGLTRSFLEEKLLHGGPDGEPMTHTALANLYGYVPVGSPLIELARLKREEEEDGGVEVLPQNDILLRPIENPFTDLPDVWDIDISTGWVVPNFLREGTVTLLSGDSGVGKSWVAYFLAGAVAQGMTLFGEQVAPRPVLYMDGENSHDTSQLRLSLLGVPETPNLHVWGQWMLDGPPGPSDTRILRQMRRMGIKPLLIWDTYSEFFTGTDQNSASQARDYIKLFKRLSFMGATVIILHHTGKSASSQEYRGSSDIMSAVDMAFLLTAPEKAKIDTLQLTPLKHRAFQATPRGLKFESGKGFTSGEVALLDRVELLKHIVRENPTFNQTAIAKAAMSAGLSKNAALELLKNEGNFRVVQGGKDNAKTYVVVEEEGDEMEGS